MASGHDRIARFIVAAPAAITSSGTANATAGSYAVVVTNPTPGGGTSNVLNSTVSAAIASLSATRLNFGNQP